MPRRRPPADDPFAEMADAARGERVTLFGVDPETYARRLGRTIDDVDQREGDAVLELLKSIAGYKRDLGGALAYEQRKGLATGFRVDNVDRVTRQIDDVTNAWVANATGLTQDHLRQIGDLGFDFLPTAIRKAGGVPIRDRNSPGIRNQWAKNEFDIEVPSVSRRQLAVAFGGYQADLVQNLGKIARTEITAAVRAGVVGELAPGAVMSRIKAFLDTPERGVGRYGPLAYQAERVVRTETMRVFNAANDASSRFLRGRLGDDGMIEVWNHSGLPGSRPNHAALDGYAVKAGTKFTVGGVACSGPHDPALPAREVINCRCTKFLWNERWGPVPRGPRPQGTAFFDSARAQRNGWAKGDRMAGLGSAGPGHGGADFGKGRGKGPGPGPITPPPTVPPTPPIAPPPPVAPIPPSIAPKPPGQVVVGKPAAGAKGKAKAKAYDPTKEYQTGAQVRAAILKEAAAYDARMAEHKALVDDLRSGFLHWSDEDDIHSVKIRDAWKRGVEKSEAALADPTLSAMDRRAMTRELERAKEGLATAQAEFDAVARLKAKGFTKETAAAEFKARLLVDSTAGEDRRAAILKHLRAKDPMDVRPMARGAITADQEDEHYSGTRAFGDLIDRRAWSAGGQYTPNLINGRPGQTLGSGTPDDPFRVGFTWSTKRAGFDPVGDGIMVDGRIRTIVHELGHWFEEHHPAVHARAANFLMDRSVTGRPGTVAVRRMGALFPGNNYRDDEVTFEDNWAGLRGAEDRAPGRDPDQRSRSVYAGKVYAWDHRYKVSEWVARRTTLANGFDEFNRDRVSRGDPEMSIDKFLDATEVVSMGLEAFYNDAADFAAQDPDYFDFIWNITKGFPWP